MDRKTVFNGFKKVITTTLAVTFKLLGLAFTGFLSFLVLMLRANADSTNVFEEERMTTRLWEGTDSSYDFGGSDSIEVDQHGVPTNTGR